MMIGGGVVGTHATRMASVSVPRLPSLIAGPAPRAR
nr:hypothetical protein [Bradyrhizobium sp. 195]